MKYIAALLALTISMLLVSLPQASEASQFDGQWQGKISHVTAGGSDYNMCPSLKKFEPRIIIQNNTFYYSGGKGVQYYKISGQVKQNGTVINGKFVANNGAQIGSGRTTGLFSTKKANLKYTYNAADTIECFGEITLTKVKDSIETVKTVVTSNTSVTQKDGTRTKQLSRDQSIKLKLRGLKEMLDEGLITVEEAASERAKFLAAYDLKSGDRPTVASKSVTDTPKEELALTNLDRIMAKNPDAVSVIIGNRNYEGDLPKVDYAHNDATAIKKFMTNLLGHDPDNIIDLRDATQAKLESTFGNERTYQGKLWSYLDPKGTSDVVIYYSGHGVPGMRDQKGYLLPTDADANQPEINGYPLDLLYANLGKLEARSITVLLDACFSGGSHRGMLIPSASPVLVTDSETHRDAGRVVVLAAASGDQLASWDEKAKHGLFTRYFLEAVYGAADADGNQEIDLSEVQAYLDQKMTRRARRDFLREQNAWISGAPDTVLVQLKAQN